MKEITRCPWPGDDPLMTAYHDREWGAPTHDDKKHFEFIVLEAAQAGLSWRTVLNKREGYRKAFAGFDPARVAKYGPKKIEELLKNPGIIRNRLKITSAVNNARAFLRVQDEFGSFDAYCWQFVSNKPKVNKWRRIEDLPATTPEAAAFSKDLKKRGFKFVGPTVIYAHMQAVGMVNDHIISCFRYREILGLRGK
jgi:DNA-3-methyladenine glycosylase I